MSKTLDQIFIANPIVTNAGTDLMYFAQSPYSANHDAAITFANFSAQFGAAYTASALTKVDDTNVTLTLGGTPATSLLQATSLTLGWAGLLGVPRGGTGIATATAYSVICAGTTATGAFQSLAALGAAGTVLTSNGAGALPSFQAAGVGGPWSAGVGTASAIGGTGCTASGNYAFAYGDTCSASSLTSYALGLNSSASSGSPCIAVGESCVASGQWSVALGKSSIASAQYSFAFGDRCTANGTASIAMGQLSQCNSAYAQMAFGVFSRPQFAGTTMFSDYNGGTPHDTAINQWLCGYDGGYYWYTKTSGTPELPLSIDANSNTINGKGQSDKSKTIVIPLTGDTVTLVTTNRRTILNPAGTLATLTVDMPASPIDGQLQTVSTTQIITALTVTGGGHSIIGQPTALTVGQRFTMIYNLGNTTWYPG